MPLYGDVVARFWSKVDRRGDDECWPWTGTLEEPGYGQFYTGESGSQPRLMKAHRFAYALLVGPIPPRLDLDHTCHDPAICQLGNACPHRRCVNPAHLEPVTEQINVLRSGNSAAAYAQRTHCPKGHPLSGANLIIRKNGARRCRACKNERERQRYAERN